MLNPYVLLTEIAWDLTSQVGMPNNDANVNLTALWVAAVRRAVTRTAVAPDWAAPDWA